MNPNWFKRARPGLIFEFVHKCSPKIRQIASLGKNVTVKKVRENIAAKILTRARDSNDYFMELLDLHSYLSAVDLNTNVKLQLIRGDSFPRPNGITRLG